MPAYWPVPLKGTLCGLPPPSSLTDKLAVRVPVIVGVKVTLIVHDCLGCSDVPQVVVLAKSLGFTPVIVIPVIERVATALALVKVTTFGALVVPTFCAEKRTPVGENDAAVPVPCSATVCGDPGALSETDKVAVRVLID